MTQTIVSEEFIINEREDNNGMSPRDEVLNTYSKEKNKPYIGKNTKIGRRVKYDSFCYIGENCVIGDNVSIGFGAYIGDGCVIGHNAEISPNAILYPKTSVGCWSKIGANCIIRTASIGNFVTLFYSSNIGLDVIVEDRAFIGPRFVCTNTRDIRHGREKVDVVTQPNHIKFGSRIGGGVTLLPGVTIGREALIGAGSVVTKNIGDFKVAYGNPAKEAREIGEREKISETIYKEYIKKREQCKPNFQSHRLSFLSAARIVATDIYYWFINSS